MLLRLLSHSIPHALALTGLVATGFAPALLAAPAFADDAPERFAKDAPIRWAYGSIQVENDLFANFANTDRHYTNGLQASFLSEPTELPGILKDIATIPVPFGADGSPATHRLGLSLGHSIFTPDDTSTTTTIADDRPYAAWLHLTLTLQTLWKTDGVGSYQDQWKIDVGVVGPAAGGRFVQNNWHKLIGADEANGWSNQLRNEPALNVTFERAWNSPELAPATLGGFEMDAIPYVVAALGNVQTYAGGGATFRIGPDLPDDFGPARIYPGIGGSEVFTPEPGFNWYLFAGIEGRVIGRDMFLDGNLFSQSHSVDKRYFVSDLRLGAVAFWEDVRVSFAHIYRTKEFSAQKKADQFGSLSLGVAF
ncbi:MAG: lipid A deacylase LpxR family protein [Parvibaculum sp.]